MHRGPQFGFQGEVVPGLGGNHGAAEAHHLGNVVGFRFQQYRVHFDPGFDAGGRRLDGLGPADFAAVRGNIGIVGHILRLEGGNAKPVLAENAAQSRRQNAFADMRGSALHH